MKPTRKRLSWLLWTLVILGLGLAIFGAVRPRPIVVEVTRPTRGAVRKTVDGEGQTRIRDRYVVAAPTSGMLGRIELEPGDDCVAGATVVATLLAAPVSLLDARSRAAAFQAVGAAEAGRDLAAAEVDRATAQREYWVRELARVRELRSLPAAPVTDAEVERAVLEDGMARAELRSREFALRVADFELARARALVAWHEAADVDGDDAVERIDVFAPISGKVLRRFRESAGVVSAGEPLLELGDPLGLEVVVDLLSSDAVQVQGGARVELTHWGGTELLEGRVRRVEPSGFTKVSALGVEEQRVNVVIDPIPASGWQRLGDGYRVELRIVLAEVDDALRVPGSCLFPWRGGWAAFQVRQGCAELMPVVVGLRGARDVEVRDGL
ncbi:MAG: efflux RND transporter periplasmic adaptor subunit, partial [Planctomycetota bacterium]